MDLKERIKLEFQKIPDEVIEVWLLPFAEEKGWPPSKNNNWDVTISGEDVLFWNNAEWEKVKINVAEITYSQAHKNAMKGLSDAYLRDVENNYLKTLGRNGKKRFSSCLRYILINGKFPVAPILVEDEQSSYEALDGNHRLLAFKCAAEAFKGYELGTAEDRREFLGHLGLVSLPELSPMQEVWVCKPKWSESKNARTRAYLRENGIVI